MQTKVKKLDLGHAYKGGLPSIYTKNIQENGDWATVGFIVGATGGTISNGSKLLIELRDRFRSREVLNQVKEYFDSIYSDLQYANDFEKGSFVDPELVVKHILYTQKHKLLSYELKVIREELGTLHRLYLGALESKNKNELPPHFEYEAENSFYPINKVYVAICGILTD